MIFIERFTIQTFKLGATLRSLLPSLPGSEMRVGSLLKINPSLNVDQEKRQESDDKTEPRQEYEQQKRSIKRQRVNVDFYLFSRKGNQEELF